MFKKICSLMILSLVTISSFLTAEIEYDIQDIGTLQTHSSQAIAINNQGQILGWYNIDGSPQFKHFFVRDRDGTFRELPGKENGTGCEINWRHLSDNGNAYGTFDGNANYAVLYIWDQINGTIKLGNLPGKEISAINNAGQVLIKSVSENRNGKSFSGPVIWQNGKITKLKGLEGNIGLESEESQGFAMNNNGDVVGQSLVYLSYKNEIYKQTHATKWINGKTIDLHNKIPKNLNSSANMINDLGDVLISAGHNTLYFIRKDNVLFPPFGGITRKLNNKFMCGENHIVDRNNKWTNLFSINESVIKDENSIWITAVKIIDINENGEVIVQGKTIYGEDHVMLLTPVNSYEQSK